MDDQWLTVWSALGRASRAARVPPAVAGAVVLVLGLVLGLHALGATPVQVLVGSAFGLLPAWVLASLALAGGHALAVGWSERLGLRQERWHHQALCLLLSLAGVVLVAVLANIGAGLTTYRLGA